jgi:hypothetical protein
MAGQPMELLTGGSGMYGAHPQPSAVTGPAQNANLAAYAGNVQPHHSVVGIVLLAVLVLFILDRAGFRFAVTAGRR